MSNKKFLVIFLVIGFLLASVTLVASATDYYVDATTGLDAGTEDGSQAEPWALISYAIGQASAGDTIHVDPDNYVELDGLIVDKNVTILADEWEITNDDVGTVTIDCDPTAASITAAIDVTADGVVMKGIDGDNDGTRENFSIVNGEGVGDFDADYGLMVDTGNIGGSVTSMIFKDFTVASATDGGTSGEIIKAGVYVHIPDSGADTSVAGLVLERLTINDFNYAASVAGILLENDNDTSPAGDMAIEVLDSTLGATPNDDGIRLQGAEADFTGTVISGNNITNVSYGIYLAGSNATVQQNDIDNATAGTGLALYIAGSSNTVKGNRITDGNYGVHINDSNAAYNEIARNWIKGNSGIHNVYVQAAGTNNTFNDNLIGSGLAIPFNNASANSVTATYCYWETDTSSTIDGYTAGDVTYLPFREVEDDGDIYPGLTDAYVDDDWTDQTQIPVTGTVRLFEYNAFPGIDGTTPAAIDTITAGTASSIHTIHVAEGTYSNPVTIGNAFITLVNQAAVANTNLTGGVTISADHVTLGGSGFTLKNTTTANPIVFLSDQTDFTISGNVIDDDGNGNVYGIKVVLSGITADASGTISGNTIKNIGDAATEHGVYILGDGSATTTYTEGVTVQNNDIYGSDGHNVSLASLNGVTIDGGSIYNAVNKDGINVASSRAVTIKNAKIYGNGDQGIYLDGTTTDVTIGTSGNEIYNNTGEGIYTDNGDNVAHHNLIYNNDDTNNYGVFNNDSTTDFNATDNYWGDPSGPHHPTKNPDGEGQEVSNYVTFDPWWETTTGATVAENTFSNPGWNFVSVPLDPSADYPNVFSADLSGTCYLSSRTELVSDFSPPWGNTHLYTPKG